MDKGRAGGGRGRTPHRERRACTETPECWGGENPGGWVWVGHVARVPKKWGRSGIMGAIKSP